ncbi:hypothetical protein EV715DRAFT_210260 [Schizophyllum commune]
MPPFPPPRLIIHKKRKPSRSPQVTTSGTTRASEGNIGGNGQSRPVETPSAPRKPKKRPCIRSVDDLPYNFDHDVRSLLSNLSRTPPGRAHRFKAFLKSVYERVAAAQASGAVCPISLLDNKTRGFLQLAHLLWRSTDDAQLDVFDCILGMKRGEFNPNCTDNLLYMFVDLHHWLDGGFFAIVPPLDILKAINHAIHNSGFPDRNEIYSESAKIRTNLRRGGKTNAAGFIFHEKVFGRHEKRLYRVVPLAGWSRKMCIYRKAADGGYYIYLWPFTGENELPFVELHNNVYLVTWNAYLSLKKAALREVDTEVPPVITAQTLAQTELDLVFQIGRYLEYGFKPPAAFYRSPPRNFGMRRQSARLARTALHTDSDYVPSDGSTAALAQGMARSLLPELQSAARAPGAGR